MASAWPALPFIILWPFIMDVLLTHSLLLLLLSSLLFLSFFQDLGVMN